jgi:membrane fusion protein (multidrug efflux system)
MKSIVYARRRPVTALIVVVALASGSVLGASKMRANSIPKPNTPGGHTYGDSLGVRARHLKDYIVGQFESFFYKQKEQHHGEQSKIVVTSPQSRTVTLRQPYVCLIHSRRHIEIRALESGYLQAIQVQEGQQVKEDDVLFKVVPILYQKKADAEMAEARLAQLEFDYTKKLCEQKVVSANELALIGAKLAKAQAKAELAQAELKFATVRAPFDGIIHRLYRQQGSLVHENEILTTLSDNDVMWVYFNVPEKQYLDYMASSKQERENQKVELELANHHKFPQSCVKITVEGQFNNETGNIPFRADFPNPDGVLRDGQTGTILISRTLENAVVIPQRATFELLDKRYIWVVGEDDVAHQRLIVVTHELEDIFVVGSGLNVRDKIVLEGIREVEEGGKVEYEFRKPDEALKNQKFHAE